MKKLLRSLLICGPSGVGKGTLIKLLIKEYPNKFGFSISSTTRKPRVGEKDGVDYHFLTIEKFKQDIEQEKFIEYATVHGNFYGTSFESVKKIQEIGKHVIFDIDIQGAKSIQKSKIEVLPIFIMPPTFQELENRLRNRKTETEETLKTRLENAKKEIEFGESGYFKLIKNDDLNRCYDEFKDYINKNL